MAIFISAARRGETPPDSLMEAADRTVDELAEWRAKIKEPAFVRHGYLVSFDSVFA